MFFSLQTVSRPVIFLQTVKPTSVYNMPQDPGQPLLKNTRKHFVETFFPHLFFLQCAVFFRLWTVRVFFGFSDLKLLLCQCWSRTHCRVFSASFNSFHVHLISFHGSSIGPNMTQDEHSQAPKFWVANIFPIQQSQSNTRNKPNLKMEVHKSNFEDADFDLSIF